MKPSRLPLLLPALVVAAATTDAPRPVSAEAKPETERVVQPRPLRLWTVLHGRLVPKSEEIRVDMKAYTGRLTIQSVVPSGTLVKQGDVLLAIDPAPVDEAVRDAAAAVEAARQAVASARLDVEALEAQQRAELAKATLRATRAAEEQQLDAARRWPLDQKDHELAVRRLEASIDDQEKELAELEKMYKASELASDTKEIVIERARRNLAITRDTLVQTRDRMRLVIDVDRPRRVIDLANEAQWSADDLEHLKARQALSRAKARQALVQAEHGLAKAVRHEAELLDDRKKLRQTAPRDGLVVHGCAPARWKAGQGTAPTEDAILEAGDTVQPRHPLLTLLEPGAGTIEVRVPEDRILRIAKGTAAEAHIQALPGRTLKASVSDIADLPDGADGGTKTFTARIALEAPPEGLRPGLSAWVEIDLGEVENALAVPVDFVTAKGGRFYCKVRDGDRVEERRVRLGDSNGIEHQIVDGLKAGDTVVKP